MKLAVILVGAASVFASDALLAQSRTQVLFIGNSFTYAAGSPVQFYRAGTVTDLNGEGVGGVPALFKSFADQAGLAYDVSLETRGGTGLDFHLAEKSGVILSRAWDTVVMHGYSTLDADNPRDPAKLIRTSKEMAELLRKGNAGVAIYLMATWSRADQTYPPEGAWAGQPIEAVIPVGEAWLRAMQAGVADPNPYDGIEANKVDLWTYDHYHGSTYGYYLEALVIFGALTGRDPRSLGDTECSAFELGLSRAQAGVLQQVAFDELARGGVKPNPRMTEARARPERCKTPSLLR
jgi:hypothetical protein